MKKLLTLVLLAFGISSAFAAVTSADEVTADPTQDEVIVSPAPVVTQPVKDETVYTPLGHGWGA